MEEELTYLTDQVGDLQKRKKYEKWLDRGYGCCALNNPEMAIIMQNALQHHDGIKYNLLAWCIMPNHVHVLIKANNDLSRIIQSWKSFTGRWALANNGRLRLGFPKEIKQFWWAESWDRFIRDEDHFNNTIRYIMANPKKAHLPEDFEAYKCMGCNIDVEEKENRKWKGKRLKLELQPAQLRVLNGMNVIQEFNDKSSNLKVAIAVNEDFSNLKLLTPALIIKYEGVA